MVEEKQEEYREGHEFSTLEDVERLKAEGVQTEPKEEPAASEEVLGFAYHMFQEIMRYQQFGGFPNGKPWGEQSWWRIALYEAFFEGLNTRQPK